MDETTDLSAFSIGVVGMDNLGAALLARLDSLGLGHTSTDLDYRNVQAHLAEGGAAPVGSPYDLAQMCNLIIMASQDGETLRECIMGSVGLIHKVQPGTVVIDMSDAAPDIGLAMARALTSRGAVWLEASPVGTPADAVKGELTFLCGGQAHVFERATPVLNLFGNKVMRLGDLGAGGMARLFGSTLAALSTAIHTEMLTFAWRNGLNPTGLMQALPILAPAAGTPPASVEGQIVNGQFNSGTPLKRLQLEIARIMDAARQSHTPMPFLAMLSNMSESAAYMQDASGDQLDVMRWIAANAGVRFDPAKENAGLRQES